MILDSGLLFWATLYIGLTIFAGFGLSNITRVVSTDVASVRDWSCRQQAAQTSSVGDASSVIASHDRADAEPGAQQQHVEYGDGSQRLMAAVMRTLNWNDSRRDPAVIVAVVTLLFLWVDQCDSVIFDAQKVLLRTLRSFTVETVYSCVPKHRANLGAR